MQENPNLNLVMADQIVRIVVVTAIQAAVYGLAVYGALRLAIKHTLGKES